MLSSALNVASTGPPPRASARASRPFSEITMRANGCSPVSEWAVSATSL